MKGEDKKFYWIRLRSDFFDLETIDWLASQKNGCEYIVLYQKLCLLTANRGGEMSFQIGDMIIPYDHQKIARDTKFDIDTVIVAMELFKKIGLIYEQENGMLRIPYVAQVVGAESSSREAIKKREYRARLRQRNEVDTDVDIIVDTEGDNLSDRDKSIEIRDKSIEIDKEKEREKKESIDYQAIVNAYNETCVSFPSCRSLSDQRKKAIRARLNSGYTIDDFSKLFEKAQASDFLKGKNDRSWTATFDWLIKDSNMAKVLDGNYDNRDTPAIGKHGVSPYKLKGAIEL